MGNNRENISSTNPEEYQSRFVDMTNKVFKKYENI